MGLGHLVARLGMWLNPGGIAGGVVWQEEGRRRVARLLVATQMQERIESQGGNRLARLGY